MAPAGHRMPDLQPGASEGGPVPQAPTTEPGRAAPRVPPSIVPRYNRGKLQALVYDILPLEEGAGKRCSECGVEGEAVRGSAMTPPDREARPNKLMMSPRRETTGTSARLQEQTTFFKFDIVRLVETFIDRAHHLSDMWV